MMMSSTYISRLVLMIQQLSTSTLLSKIEKSEDVWFDFDDFKDEMEMMIESVQSLTNASEGSKLDTFNS